MRGGGGVLLKWIAFSHRTQVRFLAFPRILLLMLLRCNDPGTKNSGPKLDYVNRTHLVLASGNLVLQRNKKYIVNKKGLTNAMAKF